MPNNEANKGKKMHINNLDFAKNNESIHGEIDLANQTRFDNIFEFFEGKIQYSIKGFTNDKNLPALQVNIYGRITTLCQSCLKNITLPIEHTCDVVIYNNDRELEEALFNPDNPDFEKSDGILADENFDVGNFVEDEIILLIPIAPKHKNCKDVSHKDEEANPFKILEQLKHSEKL